MVPKCSVSLHRSARANKYDGFRVPPVSNTKAKASKFKAHMIPSAASSVTITEISEDVEVPPPTPIPVIQQIGTVKCGIPASELTEEGLLADKEAGPSSDTAKYIYLYNLIMVLLVNWNVLCWNVHGLNSDGKQLALSNAITSSGCAIICLQETKKPTFDHVFIKSSTHDISINLHSYLLGGASGGIATIWNSSIFTATIIASEDFALVTHFQSTQSAQHWILVNVYGPCQGEQRILFINWLLALDISTHEDWLLVGDLNFIRGPDDRKKPGGNFGDMITFSDFIRSQSLIELPIKGCAYMWSNMQIDPLLEQIDWLFTSNNWTILLPKDHD